MSAHLLSDDAPDAAEDDIAAPLTSPNTRRARAATTTAPPATDSPSTAFLLSIARLTTIRPEHRPPPLAVVPPAAGPWGALQDTPPVPTVLPRAVAVPPVLPGRDLCRRLADPSGLPVASANAPQATWAPPEKNLVDALLSAGCAGVTPEALANVGPLSLFLRYDRVRAGVNSALRCTNAAWTDASRHVITAVRSLPTHCGFAYTVLPVPAGSLKEGDILTWNSLASCSSSDSPAASAAHEAAEGAGRVSLLQLLVLARDCAYKASEIPEADPSEVLVAPGARFRVVNVGELSERAHWICAVQDIDPKEAVAPQSSRSEIPEPDVAVQCALSKIDSGSPGSAVTIIRRLIANCRTKQPMHPLIAPARLMLRALFAAWPLLFGEAPGPEMVLHRKGCSLTAEQAKQSTDALTALLDETLVHSPAALWLCGLWRISMMPQELAAEGERLLERGVTVGSPLAAFALASHLESAALSTPEKSEHIDEIISLYTTAADAGLACAVDALGYIYSRGIVGRTGPNNHEAVRRFALASCAGSPTGFFHLGMCYKEGAGVAKDPVRALDLLRRAVMLDLAEAQHALGLCYRKEELGLSADLEAATRLWQQAAEQQHAGAMCQLGALVFHKGDPNDIKLVEAARNFSEAAAKGNVLAMYYVGSCLEDGLGMEQNTVEAARWYEFAAERGSIAAEYRLGLCYQNGIGVKKDHQKAMQHLHAAADQGNKSASEALKAFPSPKKRSSSFSIFKK